MRMDRKDDMFESEDIDIPGMAIDYVDTTAEYRAELGTGENMANIVRNGRRYDIREGYKHPVIEERPTQYWVKDDGKGTIADAKNEKGAIPCR